MTDRFTLARLNENELANRWNNMTREHFVLSSDLLLGMMKRLFTPDELTVLDNAGYFSPAHKELLKRAAQ